MAAKSTDLVSSSFVRKMKLLSQLQAQRIDERLMSPEFGFRLEQLMELAGLACAQAIFHRYKGLI
jgi:NAD(P)H-hydrate epimerase